jgi:hypothetical protein
VPGSRSTSSAAPAASVEGALRFAVALVPARRLQSMLHDLAALVEAGRIELVSGF